jgi:hypothetical protein
MPTDRLNKPGSRNFEKYYNYSQQETVCPASRLTSTEEMKHVHRNTCRHSEKASVCPFKLICMLAREMLFTTKILHTQCCIFNAAWYIPNNKKVKFTLEQDRRYMGGGWSTPSPGRFTPGNDQVPLVQEAGSAPGPAWMFAENFASIPGPSSS